VDVLDGQIGGPEDAIAFALVQANGDREFGLGDVVVRSGLVEAGGAASVAANGEVAEVDVDGVGIDGGAGVTNGGHEASPVGIGAGPGGFYKRRMGDGFGDLRASASDAARQCGARRHG